MFGESVSAFLDSTSGIIAILSFCMSVCAVYYTYRQSKTTASQHQLELKKVEKPRILEKINELNEIRNELEQEQWVIDQADILWFNRNPQRDNSSVPLIFPISPKKDFHIPFHQTFTGPECLNTLDFPQILERIDKNLGKRSKLYQSMGNELSLLASSIKQNGLSHRLEYLLSKLTKYRMVSDGYAMEPAYTIYEADQQLCSLTYSNLSEIVTSLLISTIIKPLEKDESRQGTLGYIDLTNEFIPYLSDSLKDQPVPNSGSIKDNILRQLEILKDVDRQIVIDIDSIKNEYEIRYTLTKDELDPNRGALW